METRPAYRIYDWIGRRSRPVTALVLSALTSVLGFAVMATAPTPIFPTFGLLTAVMIALALAASLLVLPSLVVMATPQNRRAVHDLMIEVELGDLVSV